MNVEVGRLRVSVMLTNRQHHHRNAAPPAALEREYHRERRWHDLEEARAYRAMTVRLPVI